MKPRVSVIVPTYNGEAYLRGALQSILNQTFKDFELILINDGSTDSSSEISNSFTDSRIVRIIHKTNQGLIPTLTEAFEKARGEFVVRADADDINLPNRLEKLVHFMDTHPNISIAGSWIRHIGSQNKEIQFPTGISTESQLLFKDTVEPSASIIRKSDLTSKRLTYFEKYRYSDEYDLHVRAVMTGLHIANVPEVLLEKRMHNSQLMASYEGRVLGIELMQIQKMYFSFLFKKLKFLDPRYIGPMLSFIYVRISNKLGFMLKKNALKKKEQRFYTTPFSTCVHSNCDNRELTNKNVIDLITVAFNNAETIGWQAQLIKKNFRDPFTYTVCDNSSDESKSEEIKKLCESEGIAYVRLPKNHLTRSASHGSAVNWIYRNYVLPRKANYFGFLDHDIFPVKETHVMNILDMQSIYGHLQERKDLWYLWAGFCFFKKNGVSEKLNFMNGFVGDVGLDTGGMNWVPLYSKIPKESLEFPVSKLEKIRQSRDSIASAHDVSQDHVEYIGDWVHIFSASGWKTMVDEDERDRIVQGIIRGLL